MKNRKKQNMMIGIIATIGILLILTTLWYFGKGFLLTRYKNEQNGFSIKYPVEWSFEENKNGAAAIFLSPLENDLDYFKESVNVVVQSIAAEPMELKKYSATAIKQMEAVFGDNMIMLESKPIFIASQPGYKIVFTGKSSDVDLHYMSVWTIRGLTAYQITYTAFESQYDRYLPHVKRMIRSFRLE